MSSFEEYKKSQLKEPEKGKKRYQVGCYTGEDWESIHEVLLQDGTLEDNIPKDSIECVDDKKHSATRGYYMLSDEEALELKNHPKVKYVNIDYDYYSGTYAINPRDLIASAITKTDRYSSPKKQYRYNPNSWSNISGDAELGRSGYQLARSMQRLDPWFQTSGTYDTKTQNVLNDKLAYYGDGKDVDAIVSDTVFWHGHPEFQSNVQPAAIPTNYIGGNVLNPSGTCGVLDIVLDSPMYLDPDFFALSSPLPDTPKTITRWDGTIIPNDYWARTWWTNNSTSHRSPKFVSPSNGGTATGDYDFGTAGGLSSSYTRALCCGSNTSRPDGSAQNHGTQCAANMFGRTHGWAFNANKWTINGIDVAANIGEHMEHVKVFHQLKPNRSSDNTKNPTIISCSWGYRSSSWYYGNYLYHRTANDGTGGVYYDTGNRPGFLENLGRYGDGYRCKGEMPDNNRTSVLDEAIAAGVIVCVAAGNSNQKQVKSDHPDYDNYWSSNNDEGFPGGTHSEFGIMCTNTLNRRGWPQQGGKYMNGNEVVYPVITVGALDDQYGSAQFSKERKVTYSNMGNDIDCYAPADGTLTANRGTWGAEHPATYIDGTYVDYDGVARDGRFSGTSSACPVAAGLIATKLQYHRTWTWQQIKNWLRTAVTNVDESEFFVGNENIDINDYFDVSSFQDSSGLSHTVIWDAPSGAEGPEPDPEIEGTVRGTINGGVGLRLNGGSGLTIKSVV